MLKHNDCFVCLLDLSLKYKHNKMLDVTTICSQTLQCYRADWGGGGGVEYKSPRQGRRHITMNVK